MKSYKTLTDFEINQIFTKCIAKVNYNKKNYKNSLTKEERLKVKKLLTKRLGLNNEQSDFLLLKDFYKYPTRDSLLLIEDKNANLEKYRFLTYQRQIRLNGVLPLILSFICILISVFLNIMLFKNKLNNIESILIPYLFFTIIGFGLLIYILKKNLFITKYKYRDNDVIKVIKGKPDKVKLNVALQSKYEARTGVARLLYIIFIFKHNDERFKLIYLVEPNTSIQISSKKLKKLKNFILNKELEIEYNNKSKIIIKFDYDIMKYIRRKI